MAQKLDPKEPLSWEKLAYSSMLEQEAMLRLLVKKGIITKEEYIEELKQLKQEMTEKQAE